MTLIRPSQIQQASATSGQALVWNGSEWAPATPTSSPSFTGARAYRSAALSIANTTVTTIGLDGESFDSGSLHDLTTNNSRITVPSTGKYLIVALMSYLSMPSTATAQCRVHVNGAVTGVGVLVGQVVISFTDVQALSSGDYVEMATWQNSGSSQSVSTGATNTFLAVSYLGP